MNCSNLNKVIGACIGNGPDALLITEFCSKGTLQDLLGNYSFSLDSQFKFSLAIDIAQGMLYLCESSIGFHGNLTSSICLIDNRFSVKITDYGTPSLFNKVKIDYESQEYQRECLWKAPEVLRSIGANGSKEGDIYSFGIILYEIFTREQPFADETAELGISAVISKIKEHTPPYCRPEMKDCSKQSELESLIKHCWSEVPSARPHFSQVKKVLKEQAGKYGEGTNLLDNLLRRMEQYANNLEKLVEEKTEELLEEKKRSEQLLYQILPKSVAESLKIGQPVEPEAFDSVTIYFSDIVGFTEISAKSSPLEVVNLLNDLYVCFDGIIDKLNVYKVETIGDAYMVVSGLPIRYPHHGKEIATMSLAIRKAISSFKMRHLPDHRIEIRIGLHTGPTVAGVVGVKMPRYCLFGDTVNTASRMESNGQAMKIHISSVTKSKLESCECFDLISRGEINIKGKGVMETYWLEQGD
ncbi:hypothetical protein LOTGIDRAFT_209773 [Lottia gigantea]|uniref:Guanylate cyclase n=1 Tax=Lottia gigantea TaxID=225164 RepID=V4A8R3_LOTGI|nr:hypothetical protein LOTGIDRAFT_209773 [Lottia gigantea]ESO91425.1 hypothetical protein LOTGIDRAFT_209773 [Lottia gigantea]